MLNSGTVVSIPGTPLTSEKELRESWPINGAKSSPTKLNSSTPFPANDLAGNKII